MGSLSSCDKQGSVTGSVVVFGPAAQLLLFLCPTPGSVPWASAPVAVPSLCYCFKTFSLASALSPKIVTNCPWAENKGIQF